MSVGIDGLVGNASRNSFFGWRFGINGNKGSFIVAPGVGYELEVLDDFYIYGEFDVQASFGESFKLMPGLSIGGRYSF